MLVPPKEENHSGQIHWPPSTYVFLSVLSLALVAHGASLGTYFAVDDFGAFANASPWPVPSLVDAVARRYISQPLFFYLHRAFFGADPLPYHLTIFFLHCANAWLLFRLLCRRDVGVSPTAAWAAALVFAAHPVANTALSWSSAGFNEVPIVTGTLLVLPSFLRFVEQGRWRFLMVPAVGMSVLLGVKQQALFAWTFPLVLGVMVAVNSLPGARSVRLARVALGATIPAITAVWVALWVMPVMKAVFGSPYEPLIESQALTTAAIRLIAHASNPLPLGRVEMGAQPSYFVPSGVEAASTVGLAWQLVVALTVLGASAYWAWGRGFLRWWTGWFICMVAALAWATPLSRHLQDYYAYLALPAASALLGGPVETGVSWALRWLGKSGPIVACTAMAALGTCGFNMNTTNRLVGEARMAESLVRGLEARDGTPEQICFVVPNDLAKAASVGGAALAVVNYRKQRAGGALPRAVFPSAQDESTTCRVGTRTTWLASFAESSLGAWQVDWLDQLTSWGAGERITLNPGMELRQRFEIYTPGARRLQVPLRWLGRSCGVDYVVAILADEAPQATVLSTVEGKRACSEFSDRLPVSIDLPPGGEYFEVRLKAAVVPQDGAIFVPLVASVGEPFRDVFITGEEEASNSASSPRVLAFRVVLE